MALTHDEVVRKGYGLYEWERWVHLQKVMGIDLPFETAVNIDLELRKAGVDTLDLPLPEERVGSPLIRFVQAEVPFRMKEIHEVDISDEMVEDLVDAVMNNSDVMFDYDRFDCFLEQKYDELLELDLNAIRTLQGEISFLRDEIDGLMMINGSEDLISQKEKRLAVLECQLKAEKTGVKLHLSPEKIIDVEHLDCFWYGGQIGAFEYNGYTVSIEVHGDVRLTVLDENYQDEQLLYNNRDNSGAYQNEEVLAVIKDDETLHKLIEDGRLVFSNNNWVEYLVFDQDDQQVEMEPFDNVLDNNVLDAFTDPAWVKEVIDNFIARDERKDLDDVIQDAAQQVTPSPVPDKDDINLSI